MSRLLTLHDPATARRYYEAGLWHDETFYALLAKHAAARPDAKAVRDSARHLTWGQLKDWVDTIADSLHEAGVVTGERVALWASNRVEVVASFLACSRNGYVCNPSLHRNYTVEEIAGLLQRVGATAAVVETGWGADTDRHDPIAALRGLEAMRRVFVLPPHRAEGDLPGVGTAPRHLREPDPNPDSICYLAFTSGTTGKPKGVMHSDNSLLANCRDLVKDWHHDSSTVLLTLSPLSHHIAWVAVGQWLVAGMQLVIDDPAPGLSRLDWMIETGATYVMGVPTHAMDIQAEQARRGIGKLGSVNLFYMAGSPIPPAVAERFVRQGVRPQNIYGMTENSSHQYTHPVDDEATICATCGRGGAGYEVRIFSQENRDEEVPPGTIGEIGGKGAALMLGYFDNQAATEGSFNRDGWFLSGDLGVLDGNGNLSIVGRLKDVVIRGGHNIFPARVEDLAVKHPNIAKAAAFPVPDERLGEKLALAILPSGESPDAATVLNHLYAVGLSKYDMPEYFLVMDSFPLTPSGKILKRELAEWAKSGRIAPEPCRFKQPEDA
ncbi:class I adenylate-forming enzyme family protein [Thalassobaculum sp. OXR-137]|uniref:class I adenylate-forming enzyme family protein n=1 Tax=Thalassobaculum sp. OXR-137 TaxID=3100173 RepID=UPI002AC95B79|nr:class I adenylate-forming enzyme family protein [Thalassobaculum sp. OXR-137]WPZ33016.1 class I adenylate-forming enzyme family protein [Thalassobaculum sp. OXR-137]